MMPTEPTLAFDDRCVTLSAEAQIGIRGGNGECYQPPREPGPIAPDDLGSAILAGIGVLY